MAVIAPSAGDVMRVLDRQTKAVLFEVPSSAYGAGDPPGIQKRNAVAWARKKHIGLQRAWLRGADLRNMDLNRLSFCNCDLTDADFAGTNIERCTFTGAVLKRANFDGAKWGPITLARLPKHLQQLYSPLGEPVWVLDSHMQIGCEIHTHEDWRTFGDRDILRMDGRLALDFWRRYRVPLLAICDAAARGD